MPFLITFLAWIVASLLTDGKPVSLLLAIMCGVIYSQGRRLQDLEKGRVKPAPAPADIQAPNTEEQVTAPLSVPAALKVEDEKTAAPQPAAPPSKPTPQPAPSVSAPARSTSQMIEGLLGPTLAGFILRGNPIARIGVVILFFGVVFALKFAAEEGFIPIEVRLLAAALGSFALLGIGWRLRKKSRQFSVTLQGAGAGVFYITAFIAFRLYHLIPGPFAFALLFGVTILSAALAVLQSARSLAVVAMIGGFLAPALTSEGGGSHIMLFSYLALLNLGIFAICWFKSWRELNLTGFFFTFVMASLWGERYYRPEFLVSSDAFLIFFVVLYSVITVLFASRNTEGKAGTVDTLMTFGTPLWAFMLQYGLVKNIEYGLAWSATGFGAFYIILAKIVFTRFGAQLKLLVQSYFFIGLCFLSLAVPLAFSGRLTSAIWAVEGLALIWSGIKQKHWLTRFAGELLILLASFFFFTDMRYSREDIPFLNAFFEGVVLLSFSCLFAARLLKQADSDAASPIEKKLATFFSLLGLLWWLGGGYIEVWRHIAQWHDALHRAFPNIAWGWIPWGLNVYSVFTTFSVLLFWLLARHFSIYEFKFLRKLLMPVHLLALALLLMEANGSHYYYWVHPFMSLGFVSWAFVFISHYSMLYCDERDTERKPVTGRHIWALLVATVVFTWEIFTQLGRFIPDTNSWALSALEFVPAIVMLAVSAQVLRDKIWPFKNNAATYLKGLRFLALWLVICTLSLDFSQPGYANPLPYIPLLNPLDIGQAGALLALIRWWIACTKTSTPHLITSGTAVRVMGAWAFVWATILLLRCVHHYGGVAWDVDWMLRSNTVQAALSIFWSALALILMTSAHLKGWRAVWKAGACLIGVVVIKLFLIDLSSQATIARIAAFLAVGLLMLCIGYFAPIPPEKSQSEK